MYSIQNRDDLEKLKNCKNQNFVKSQKIKRETWEARLSLR